MDSANREELRQWVTEQTAQLDPPEGWLADADAALHRMHARISANPKPSLWHRWPTWAAALAALLAAFLLLPAGRVTAQQFWQHLAVTRVAFLVVNPWPEGVPSPEVKLIGAVIPPIPANDVDQVHARVNYVPRLPNASALSGSPRLSTTFSLSAGTVVHVADLELALQKTGVTGVTVPPAWEGVRIVLHTSPVVIAEWPDVTLAQSLPPTLSTPTGFDFTAYSPLILRVH